jgi:hypothetical protein
MSKWTKIKKILIYCYENRTNSTFETQKGKLSKGQGPSPKFETKANSDAWSLNSKNKGHSEGVNEHQETNGKEEKNLKGNSTACGRPKQLEKSQPIR